MRHKWYGDILTGILFIIIFFITEHSSLSVLQAEEKSLEVIGKVYEFDDKSEYEISSTEVFSDTNKVNTLGKLLIDGNVLKVLENDEIPIYEISNDDCITISYANDHSWLDKNDEGWYLVEDSKKKVDGIKLGKKVGKCAIIIQTSLDRKNWTEDIRVNFAESSDSEPILQSNDIQLINGCFYKFIVVYELQRENTPTKIAFWNKKNYERKKCAEVYEFYASYNDAERNVAHKEKRFNLGDLVKTEKDKGYSGSFSIDVNDPHFGWELGNFFISGYTDKTDDNVFLKNVGDEITLWFNLKQNIYKLHDNSDLSVIEDKDGWDRQFQIDKMNFGYGTLIIRYIDYEGVKHDPVIYQNYLQALTSENADVKVQFFEEGDYEVALDYKIGNSKKIVDKTNDYRISFNFKVRNSNCMVYPFDIHTKTELKNSSVTENGFYLDMANSRYLKINIMYARWTKGVDGYIEDIRINKSAKDGDEYTDEGIYTIEVSNPTTGAKTEKKIYVGKDNILKASMNTNNASYTVNQIADLVENGAEIMDDGTIVLPVQETTTIETEESIRIETEEVMTSNNIETEEENTNDFQIQSSEMIEKNDFVMNENKKAIFLVIVMGIIIIGGAILIIVLKGRNKK